MSFNTSQCKKACYRAPDCISFYCLVLFCITSLCPFRSSVSDLIPHNVRRTDREQAHPVCGGETLLEENLSSPWDISVKHGKQSTRWIWNTFWLLALLLCSLWEREEQHVKETKCIQDSICALASARCQRSSNRACHSKKTNTGRYSLDPPLSD